MIKVFALSNMTLKIAIISLLRHHCKKQSNPDVDVRIAMDLSETKSRFYN